MTSSRLTLTMMKASLILQFLIIGIILQVRLSTSVETCPSQFTAYNGYCLRMLSVVTTIDGAYKACKENGGRLAAPATKQDVVSIENFIKANKPKVGRGAYLSPILRDVTKLYWRSSGEPVANIDKRLLAKLSERRAKKPMLSLFISRYQRISTCGTKCKRHPLCDVAQKKGSQPSIKGAAAPSNAGESATASPSAESGEEEPAMLPEGGSDKKLSKETDRSKFKKPYKRNDYDADYRD